MRVIAGENKGKSLKAVPGTTTRPTSDKIKEAVFQVIGPFFQDGVVLDLYAGSGSLGIEALSRGMDQAVFVDKQGKSIQTIKENLKAVNLLTRAEVYRNDAVRALKALAKRELAFDLILLDPPYNTVDFLELFTMMDEANLMKQGGFIYCEHDPNEELPTENEKWTIMKKEKYSNTIAITIYYIGKKG